MNKKFFYSLLLGALAFTASEIVTEKASAASSMSKAQKGKILLQVEANGEAWYVSPKDEMRYYMGRPTDAFNLMRQLGVGITTANLNKIKIAAKNMSGTDTDGDGLSDMFEDAIGTDKNKIDTDGDGHDDKKEFLDGYNPNGSGSINYDTNFSNNQKGKIFLQIENNGEAWYINPSDGMRYFMGRPTDAFGLMRGLGLGITNANLGKISVKNNFGNSNSNNPKITDDVDPALNAELSAIVNAHQDKIREFTKVYDLYEKSTYESLSEELFVSGSQATSKKLTDNFFIEFAEYTLKKLNDMDLDDEYIFAIDEETMLPYEKVNETTIVIGMGVDFIMPYELKNENKAWKIDLDMAKSYYNETAKIEDKEDTAEASEVEVYIMGKIKSALKEYKNRHNEYPKYLKGAISEYSVLKDYADDYYYVSLNSQQKCHFGIDVDDDESKLNSDSDFNSLDDDYLNGFDGEDPVYDIVLE